MPPDVQAFIESSAVIELSAGLNCTSHTLTVPPTVGEIVPAMRLPSAVVIAVFAQPVAVLVPVTVNVVDAVGLMVVVAHVAHERPADGLHEYVVAPPPVKV